MSYYSSVVKCPYYQHDNIKESTITCESILPGSTIKHHFPGKQALGAAIRERCAGDYESCPWYKLVCVKWGEG